MNPTHPVYLADLNAALDGLPDCGALRNARIMVTGATGMIGSCLIDMLSALDRREHLGLRPVALCRNAERARERFHGMNVEIVPGDVVRPGVLPPADYIVHAASNAHPMAFSTDPVGTMLGNFTGTLNLLEHLRASGGKRLLFVSTGEIYGENPAVTDGFAEDDFGRVDSMAARSCYPESKRAAETLCASYVRQYGADAVVVRLCYVYGPTLSPDSTRADAQFLRKALAGEDIVMKSDGAQLRSYCYVADAAAGLMTVLLCGRAGEAYNVANRDSAHTIRDYAGTLAELSGVRQVFERPPEAERQGYSTVSRAVQDPSKLEALGWKPLFSLTQGLAHTLAILRPSGAIRS